MGRVGIQRGVKFFRFHTLLSHYFLRVIECDIAYRLPTGEWGPTVTRVRVDRGRSVASLLFDPSSRRLHFVRQFRLPTYDVDTPEYDGKGWLVEIVAGRAKPDEAPEVAIAREIQEELDLQVRSVRPIGQFFLSPGASSEDVVLFFSEVAALPKGATNRSSLGDADEGHIEPVSMTVDEFLDQVERQLIYDAKTICAAEWLRRNRHLVGAS